MSHPTSQHEEHHEHEAGDGVDRRGFLKCMAWAGTGLVWTVAGGVLSSCRLGQSSDGPGATADFTFVQISDSHIGFNKDPNQDVTATFQVAMDRIKALPSPPAFIIHTGDLTHLSKADEFDTVDQIARSTKVSQVFFVPGEHDTFVDNGRLFLQRFGKGDGINGWQSFNYKGVHVIGLVNVWNLEAGGFGVLGRDQLDWLRQDVQALSGDTPIIVFAHVPLWSVYPQWGWGTDDAEEALSYLRRFSSVTVLNGHIHQVLQKVEGNVTFHTAASTAYPQPAPGLAPAPGPFKVRSDQLLGSLGVREVTFVQKHGAPTIVDTRLG